jgi:penicillin-binding protein 2
MKNARALLWVAGFFFAASAPAAEPGRVCDRHGVLLIEVARARDGVVTWTYPLKAFAAHVLSDLSPTVLPKPGEIVYLTLDARAQMAAEQALRAVSRGCAIVMDPQNGDILAMASVPSFDPGAGDGTAPARDPTEPLRNRATSAYAPGAIFLPVTVLAGLSLGKSAFEHNCTGSVQIGNRMMKCWMAGKGGSHGPQKMADGLKNSCNPFFYQLGVETGPDQMTAVAEFLGFGAASGLPLQTESAGLVAVKEHLVRLHPPPKPPADYTDLARWMREWLAGPRRWTPGMSAIMAIGQGDLLATPLQMAGLAAALASDETLFRPRLINRVVRSDGTVERKPPVARGQWKELGLARNDVKIVRDALMASVNDPAGNAQKGRAPGFRVGGRTGTAQFWRGGKKDNHTAFIGFADSGEKSYAFCVFVQGAKSGGGIAAPLAARILTSLDHSVPAALEPAAGSFDFVPEIP